MNVEETVTHWIGGLKGGDEAAAERLWQRYFQRLVGLARAKLGTTERKAADEEDVALSAFDSFCRGAAQGKFPQLTGRDSLWPLLVVLTVRKACDQVNHERRQKRGGGRVHAEGDYQLGENDDLRLDRLLSDEPTPEFAAMMSEQCDQLLTALDDDQRAIALGKLQGYSNEELASQLDCGMRTIERRLGLIRRIWQAQAEERQSHDSL